MLFNLLGNAVKFTFKGQVTLTLDFDELSKMLQVDVEDTGVGIKPEDLSRLFKFFSCILRTKDCNRGGMGLGLTISKMIVQELGGEFTVSSTYGLGSKFSFTLLMDHFEYQAAVEDDDDRSLDDQDIGQMCQENDERFEDLHESTPLLYNDYDAQAKNKFQSNEVEIEDLSIEKSQLENLAFGIKYKSLTPTVYFG